LLNKSSAETLAMITVDDCLPFSVVGEPSSIVGLIVSTTNN